MNDGASEPPDSSPLFGAARWQQIRALLETLVDISAEAREAEIVRIAASDAELASNLRELLAGPRDTLTQHLDRMVERALPCAGEQMPTRVGAFRVLQRIGAGGMGTVYLAEREHADFVQRVALKLLDVGSASLAKLATRERRILAALTHPNITAFVDAGTQDGRAWLAMEYVQGETLIEHCRQRDLDPRERVRLFDQVCAAVAHAHAQLVVHRDLKPSNILVDAQGHAKLLDFGIALVLDDGEAAAPATRVFTPEYAAPEQLRGERVTTASDVYSLGLILYELVAGKRLDTLERTSRDDAWTASELARFATVREASERPAAMQPDAKTLSQLLRGDLGRIIAHAIHPLPTQRYASVASLREDLARWLEYRPLTIARPDRLYLLRRFVRRHRAGVAAAVLGLAAIMGLAATALWQARAKTLEAAAARAALRQSEATRDFMSSVFLSADPNQGKGAQTTAGELLAVARARIDQDLAQEPAVAAPLLMQIGNVYVTLGDKQAVSDSMTRALAYNARSAHPSTVLEGSAKARLAYQRYSEGHTEEALRALTEAIALLRAAGAEAHADLAIALRLQSNVLFAGGAKADALAGAIESVQLLEKLGRARASDYLLSVQILGDMLASLERHDEALSVADRGLAHSFAQQAEYAMLRSGLQGVRARALTGLKRYAEAEPALAEVIAAEGAAFGAEHFSTRYWRFRYAELLGDMGRLDAASAEMHELLTVPASGDEHRLASMAHLLTAARIDEARRAADAAAYIAKAQVLTCSSQGHPPFCAKARLLGAEVAIRERRADAARAALDDCAADEVISSSELLARRLKILRARLARDIGELASARALLDEAQSGTAVSPEETAMIDIERGYLALAAGDRPAASAALTRGRAHIARTLDMLTPQVREIDAALQAATTQP